MTASVLEKLINFPPKLHYWDGDWRVGGMGTPQLRLIARYMKEAGDRPVVFETGAGLSSLVFLALGGEVTSFFNKGDLHDRIADTIRELGLPNQNWTAVIGFSEFTFPKHLDENPKLSSDIVLIDGGHLICTVFTDFTYAFASLKKDGVMLIDDIQLPAISVLYKLLKASKSLEEIQGAGKLVAFRKKVSDKLPQAWDDVPLEELVPEHNDDLVQRQL
jgi:hypothetical protein